MNNNSNNNENNNNEIPYSIPGVIIPPQETENGTVIQSGVSNTSNTSATQSTAPQVPTPQAPVSPSVAPTPAVAPPVAPQSSVTPPVSSPPPTPPVTTTPPVSSPPPADNSGGGGHSGVYIFLILILLGVSGYLGYQQYTASKNKVDPVKEYQKKRTVHKTSFVVQSLYHYVNLTGCYTQISFLYDAKESVSLSDLSDENKNYLAYLQLKNNDISVKNCGTYSAALHKNDTIGLWYCGVDSDGGDDSGRDTTVFSEDVLRSYVDTMFGEGSYKATSFDVGNGARFLYDSKTSSYIYQSFYNTEGECNTYSNTLVKASQQGDYLTIAVKVENNQNKNLRMFYYTFVESDDGNYYFHSLKKMNVEK